MLPVRATFPSWLPIQVRKAKAVMIVTLVKYKNTKILVHQNFVNFTFAQNSVPHDGEDVKGRQFLY